MPIDKGNAFREIIVIQGCFSPRIRVYPKVCRTGSSKRAQAFGAEALGKRRDFAVSRQAGDDVSKLRKGALFREIPKLTIRINYQDYF
jgi:hypothetical protein